MPERYLPLRHMLKAFQNRYLALERAVDFF